PLADGSTTRTTSPESRSTRDASTRALTANADPVSRWHQVQWQQWTSIGRAVILYRTWPQVQPPSAEKLSSVAIRPPSVVFAVMPAAAPCGACRPAPADDASLPRSLRSVDPFRDAPRQRKPARWPAPAPMKLVKARAVAGLCAARPRLPGRGETLAHVEGGHFHQVGGERHVHRPHLRGDRAEFAVNGLQALQGRGFRFGRHCIPPCSDHEWSVHGRT